MAVPKKQKAATKPSMLKALANFFSLAAEADGEGEANETTPKAACGTCGADGCDCGENCATQACGCCDECKATSSDDGGDGDGEGGGSDAAAQATINRLRSQLVAEKVKAAQHLSDVIRAEAASEKERVARVDAEVTSFVGKLKVGKNLAEAFTHLYRGAKLGTVQNRKLKVDGGGKPVAAGNAKDEERFEVLGSASLSAEQSAVLVGALEQIAASLPQAETPGGRVEAGGPSIDAAARAAAGSGDVDSAAIGREAAARVKSEGTQPGSADWSVKFSAMVAKLTKEGWVPDGGQN